MKNTCPECRFHRRARMGERLCACCAAYRRDLGDAVADHWLAAKKNPKRTAKKEAQS